MSTERVIHWFRKDLRLQDNPALSLAAEQGTLLPIYILDDDNAGDHAMGAASRWWLHQSLTDLNRSLHNKLQVYRGDAKTILEQLCEEHKVTAVFWNRSYEPWRIARDSNIKESLTKKGVSVKSCNAALLWEPWEVLKKDGTPYKVFTPYYRKGCLNAGPVRDPISAPAEMRFARGDFSDTSLDDLKLMPTIHWYESMAEEWNVGEQGAQQRLQTFLEERIGDYKEGRNYPAREAISKLSPHLHFGEISPHQIWHSVSRSGADNNVDTFQSELGWREFSHSLLYHFPTLPKQNLQSKFDAFAWGSDSDRLAAWQQGQTGYPIVDAGMRELWQTGFMHNRVRMIVGSFLVKNLLLHWHHGERWFWDCLVDADLANNSASWQWIAGCGADAAPYFRVFNPVTQGEKFDADGEYTRHFVPELKNMPKKYLFQPWAAPAEVLREAGVELGVTYPHPIVDLKASREKALAAFKQLKDQ